MNVKSVVAEDFVNYKKPSMVIAFPTCTFKCEKELCGMGGKCQNRALIHLPTLNINISDLIYRYLANNISKAIVCAGLEPFDSFNDLFNLVFFLRNKYHCYDDVVIYTGYNEDEIENYVNKLIPLHNIVIKYGRFRPNQTKHYDEVLGVYLSSNNQYAKRYDQR